MRGILVDVRRLLVVLPTTFCFVGACSYYDASLLDGAGTGGTSGTGTDAAADSNDSDGGLDALEASPDSPDDSSADAGCVNALPPEPPTVADSGGAISFVVAASMVDFGDLEGSEPTSTGYDLDMRCTCPEANGCLREAWASEDACDGPGGRDNMTGKFLKDLGSLFTGMGSSAWNDRVVQGDWSLLLRVSGYNGLPNDDRVRLDWYIPTPFYALQDGGAVPPAWDGNDTWPISKSCLETPPDGETWNIDDTRFYDDRAYISDGVLVASVGEASIEITKDYILAIVGAFMTAQVVQEEERWVLKNAILAGRWPVQNILSQISHIKDPLFDMYICTDNPAYSQFKANVCSFVDIYSGVGTPTTPCDSVSAGMRFETKSAQLGVLVDAEEQKVFCDPSVDPANDSCDTIEP